MFTSSLFRPPSKRHRPTARLAVEQLEVRDCPSGSYLLVSSYKTDNVLRYDADTGAFVDEFIPQRSGRLNQPWGVIIGPDDHNVYVSTGHFQGPGQIKAVLRYDGATGAFLDEVVRRGQMPQPHAVVFGPDGNLYVGDQVQPGQGRIARFDGATGAYLNDFVAPGSGGLGHPIAHVFGPSERGPGALDLFVSDEKTHSILRYDGATGAFLGVFVPGGSGGLGAPLGLMVGPDGNLYVADGGYFGSTPAVLRFQGPSGSTPGAFMDAFVPAGRGGLFQPFGVLFGPDRNSDGLQDLYVTSADLHESSFTTPVPHTSSVKVYDGVTGGHLLDFVDVDSGGLNTPTLMTFTETDPVTLAYTGQDGAAFAASPSASSTTAAAMATQVNGGGPALLAADVPFTFTGTLHFVDKDGKYLVYAWEGQADYLGPCTGEARFRARGDKNRQGFLTLQNDRGDSIEFFMKWARDRQTGESSGVWEIIGGTGLFADASGSGVLHVIPGGVVTLEGAISY